MDADLIARFALDGRRAVVIGAGRGIGREIAIVLAKAGAALVVADIDTAELAVTVDAIHAAGAQVEAVPLDVRDREAVLALGARADAGGGIDVWVNVAGVISAANVADMAPEEYDRIVAVNMTGVYWGCAAAARIMTPRGRGSIVNISSTGADVPSAGLSVYAMTKAAVNMLTRSLAHEVGPHGVRVNAVAPGFVDTPMVTYRFRDATGAIDERQKQAIFAARADATVLKRVGTVEDIASAVLYLAADASAFVTGQILRPNGGLAMP
ncbi:SDR family NAD(P)-dependent oxidoreductase [Sphingomonas immobilis]|uniref:SDR family NAD(P)-dependent oxidoreductase n=1 Tax=Sphingomonas immobilis TaxID=3063997 RepID=A0ABT8ZX29_9SPHN|nr:SDR family NAD(P)-dependent oxidoreductase [Sphingomonas sp. CA1-15]MDO7842131.1 SDR family NAD(P)-dependent oxidoreductase [Sphingomonas sp. CA1-15]